MFQNLKVDVIYYKTNTDFEMEFNLCGCCRMRLLTDKTPDKKTMVLSLARAVNRSRVILIVGNLFGDEGIIKLAAEAIGGTTSPADNKTYGIAGDEDIQIIDGSVPLVTAEGYFGGCIIESGPQTLILLSENKNIRKAVMKTLIHPYIEELCAMELKEKAESAAAGTNKPEEAVETQEIAEPVSEEVQAEEVGQDEPDDLIINSPDEDQFEVYSELEDLVVDTEDEQDIEMESLQNELLSDEDDETLVDSDMLFDENTISMKDFIIRNDEYYNDQETVEDLITEDETDDFIFEKRLNLNLPIFIVTVLLLVLLVVLCYCIFYVPSKDGISASVYVREVFYTLFG